MVGIPQMAREIRRTSRASQQFSASRYHGMSRTSAQVLALEVLAISCSEL